MLNIIIPVVCIAMIIFGVFLIGWGITRFVMNNIDDY